MLTKNNLSGRLPQELINKINENFEFLFDKNEELSNSQIIESLVNKALSTNNNETDKVLNELQEENELLKSKIENSKTSNNQVNTLIPEFFKPVLEQHLDFEKLKKFYAKKDWALNLNTDNEDENMINLLINFFSNKMFGEVPQPELSNRRKMVKEAFETLK